MMKLTPTRTSTLRLIRLGAFIVIAGAIVAYAIWRSLNYARGPEIDVFAPSDGASISSTTVEITGRALRVSAITLNGNALTIDEAGHFDQTVIVFPGPNTLSFDAHDQFGRATRKNIRIVGTASFPSNIY